MSNLDMLSELADIVTDLIGYPAPICGADMNEAACKEHCTAFNECKTHQERYDRITKLKERIENARKKETQT